MYYRLEVFGVLDVLVQTGKVPHYGVSVEKVEEALKAIEYTNVQTVQIIFNMFRQRPAERFFKRAQEENVGILACVPLASGLLTGKFSSDTRFVSNDHRNFNREGESFDRGETLARVEFECGLRATEELEAICPDGMSMVQFALRWIMMFDAVASAIPGVKRPSQVEEKARVADQPPLSDETMSAVRDNIYDQYVCEQVHQRWWPTLRNASVWPVRSASRATGTSLSTALQLQ